MRVHLRTAHELCERLTEVRRRAETGNEETDGTVLREMAQVARVQVVDDDHAERRRAWHRVRPDYGCCEKRREGDEESDPADPAGRQNARGAGHRVQPILANS